MDGFQHFHFDSTGQIDIGSASCATSPGRGFQNHNAGTDRTTFSLTALARLDFHRAETSNSLAKWRTGVTPINDDTTPTALSLTSARIAALVQSGREDRVNMGSCPSDQMMTITKALRPLLVNIPNPEERAAIFDSVMRLPDEEQIVPIIQKATPFLEGVTDWRLIGSAIQALGFHSEDQINRIIQQATRLQEGITDEREKGSMFKVVASLIAKKTAEEITDISEQAILFSENLIDGKGKASVLQALMDISRERRIHIVEVATPLLKALKNGKEKGGTIYALSRLSREQRIALITDLNPILGILIAAEKGIAYTIYGLGRLSQENRTNVMREANLIQEIMAEEEQEIITEERKITTLQALNRFFDPKRISHQSKLDAIITKQGFLLSGITDQAERISIIQAVKHLPKRQEVAIIQEVAPLLERTTDARERAFIIEIASYLPQGERAAFIDGLTPILMSELVRIVQEDITDRQGRAKIVQALNWLPRGERIEIIRMSFEILLRVADGSGRANIIETLGCIPPSRRPGVLNTAAPFLEEMTSERERRALFQAVTDLPEGQEFAITQALKPLLEDATDWDEVLDIIYAVSSLSEGYEVHIIQFITPYLLNISNKKERARLFESITPLEPEYIEIIARQTWLFQGMEDSSEYNEIIKAVKSLSPGEAEAIMGEARDLLETTRNGLERKRIIEILSPFTAAQRKNIISKGLLLLDGATHGIGKADILNATLALLQKQKAACLQGQEGDLIKEVLPLLEGIKSGRERAIIIHTLSYIPTDKMTTVIRAVTLLLTNVSDASKRVSIIEVVNSIPEQQIPAIIEMTIPLLKGIADERERASIINNVCLLFQDKPEAINTIIRAVIPLLTNVSDASKRVSIIEVVTSIPEQRVPAIIEMTIPLLKGIADESEIANIIRVVYHLHEKNQQALDTAIRQVTPLLTNLTDRRKRLTVIEVVASIPEQQIPIIINKATPFLEGITDEKEIADIICAVFCLPEEERDAIIEDVIPLLVNRADGKRVGGTERADIISIASGLHRQQRITIINETIHLLIDFFLKGLSDIRERSIVIEALRRLPGGEEVEIIKIVCTALKGTKSGAQRAGIIDLASSLPNDNDERSQTMLEVANFLPSLLANITDETQIAEIIKAIKLLFEKHETAILERVAPLAEDIMDEKERVAIIHAMRSVDESKMHIIFEVTPLLKRIKNGNERACAITIAGAFSESENIDNIEKAIHCLAHVVTETKQAVFDRTLRVGTSGVSPVAEGNASSVAGGGASAGGGTSSVAGGGASASRKDASFDDILPQSSQSSSQVSESRKDASSDDILPQSSQSSSQVSEEERIDTLQKIASFLIDMESKQRKESLVSLVASLSKRKLVATMKDVDSLASGIRKVNEKTGIFEAVLSILSQDQRKDIIRLMIACLEGVNDEAERAGIIEAVIALSRYARQEILSDIALLLDYVKDGTERACIIYQANLYANKTERLNFIKESLMRYPEAANVVVRKARVA